MSAFQKYKNLKGKFEDEILTAAVNDVLHLQISITAAAKKHNMNHASLIRYSQTGQCAAKKRKILTFD